MASILPLFSWLQQSVTWTLKCGPVVKGRLCELGLFCMQRIAPVTSHIENSIAGVFANWILRGKFKQILLKANPSKV